MSAMLGKAVRAKRATRNVKNDKTTLNKSEVEEGVKYD